MERKLASVQRVLGITEIIGADAIELVQINGWQCVTKKGEFVVGDLGVFFEIDSIPPDTELFRFLWTPKTVATDPDAEIVRPAKFRIRTMKLRGALSQGLFLPLQAFLNEPFSLTEVSEGDDLTELLGVEKYEVPIFSKEFRGDDFIRGLFPSFIPKTDEMRVQSVPEVLGELRGLPYVATLKCDGTSSTFCIDRHDNEFHACGRNYSIKDGDNAYWNIARKYELETRLRETPHLAIQGEICGPGIQKNRLGLKEPGLFVFNVYDHLNARYFSDAEMRDFCAQSGLTAVAVVEQGEEFAHTLESLLALAEGKYPGTQTEREGIVLRPQHERYSQVLRGRLSFKAISNRFLLKEGE